MTKQDTPPCPDVLHAKISEAYALLVDASTISVLTKHESAEELFDAIDCLKAAFVWLQKPIKNNG
jgi:hypothetical protein